MKRNVALAVLALILCCSIYGMDIVEYEVLCSANDVASILDSEYAAGRIEIPPDKGKEGHAQVVNTHSGASYWARYVMPSHKPKIEELEEGQWILYNISVENPQPLDWEYRHQIWRFGVVTSIREAFKGVIEVNFIRCYLQWCRLPDVPLEVAFRGGEVLCSEKFQELRTEINYRYGSWYLMRITSLRDLFQGLVEVNGVNMPLEWVRVPEYSPDELKAIDMAEIVREAKAQEALDWIRQQRVLADWRIRKHAERLEAKRAESPGTAISAEDIQKDLEFFAKQTDQALEIIERLGNRVEATAPSISGELDSTSLGKYSSVKGTKKYPNIIKATTREIYDLIRVISRPALESLNTVEYHTPFQSELDDTLDDLKDAIEEKPSSSGDDADLASQDLQDMMEQQQEAMNAMSNVIKTIHDVSMAAIRNLR